MAAEILISALILRSSFQCFNEAAANGRGNRRGPWGLRAAASRFNEAAANGRGNPETAC